MWKSREINAKFVRDHRQIDRETAVNNFPFLEHGDGIIISTDAVIRSVFTADRLSVVSITLTLIALTMSIIFIKNIYLHVCMYVLNLQLIKEGVVHAVVIINEHLIRKTSLIYARPVYKFQKMPFPSNFDGRYRMFNW